MPTTSHPLILHVPALLSSFPLFLRHVLPQPPQPLLRPLQHVILLTDREPQPIFRHPHILPGVELRRRDGREPQLHDQEPRELVIPRAIRHLRREHIILWQIDPGEVRQDEIAAFGLRVLMPHAHQFNNQYSTNTKKKKKKRDKTKKGYMTDRQTQLVKHGAEPLDLAHHFLSTLLPEPQRLGLLESHRRGFLQRGNAGEADARVGGGHVVDQVCRADEPADAPAGAVEVLAGGADGESSGGNGGGEGCDAGEGGEWETVVDLELELF